MYKFISSLLFFFVFFILFQTRSYASEYFDRSYNVVYTVTENATTNVSIQVSLTNKTSDYYASADTIEVGFPSVTNVKVTDPDGPITPRVVKTDTGNQIEINFNKKVVGKDNTLVFTVVFDTSDIARHDGNVWEINIPGISDPAEFKDFKTEVKVPSSLGAPTYIKPVQKDNSLVFTKEQLGKSGISLAFGEEQLYAFDLDYHLRNSNVFPIRTEIALPPSTNYQEVAIESIEPKPENVRIDKDGNWLALYVLTPTQKVDVRVRGKVSISKEPLVKEPLPRSEYGAYLKEQPYWQVSNADIKKLAAELKTPRAIYDYVVKTLEYDFERVARNDPRKGALKTLQDPQSSVCLEFTDLFIALSRAAGIPAREVNGYAFTENPQQRPLSLVKDILHAWPEYYDEQKGTWIMVDPTWGNTTGGTDYFDVFDFDHIVFVRKGLDSQYPVPAGGYKYDGDENKKDIRVSFAKSFPTADALLQIQPQFPSNQLSALPISGSVTVQNVSSRMSKPSSILVTSQNLQPQQQSLSLPAIPPYGTHTAQVSFKKTPFLSNDVYSFTIKLGQTIIKRSVAVTPYSFTKTQLIGGIGIVVLTICILIIATKARSVRIFR